jgi:chemotaxis protein CheD
VFFFPQTGKVMVNRLPHAHDAEVAAAESVVRQRLSRTPVSGGVELF